MDSTRLWHLLGRKLAGEATLEEIRELEKLLAESPEIAAQAEIHAHYFAKNHKDGGPTTEESIAWQRQLRRMQDEAPEAGDAGMGSVSEQGAVPERSSATLQWRGRRRRIGMLASAAVLLSLVILFVWQRAFRESSSSLPGGDNSFVTELKTTVDKIKNTLPDGSIVWLNSNSRISYDKDFGKNNRNLTLTGEAFFDVVHKAELPMVVHAGLIDIRVKGTAFNVRSYQGDDEVEASLIRGSIELTFAVDRDRKIMLKPNEKIVVRRGESDKRDSYRADKRADSADKNNSLHYRIDSLAVESRSGLIPEISWIENKLVFNSEPLRELTEKMERWYHVRIQIKDTMLSEERFTGVLENETLTEALSALQLTYPFHYSIDKDQVIISKK